MTVLSVITALFRLRGRVVGGDGPPSDHLRRELAASETGPDGTSFWYGYGSGVGDLAAESHLLFRADGDSIWHDIIGAADGSTVFRGVGSELTGVQPAITTTEAVLTSAVDLIANDTWTDAVTLSLAAGTWLVTGHITLHRNTNTNVVFQGRISDGTTHYASGQQFQPSIANNNATTMAFSRVITLASTKTIRLQGLCGSGASGSANQIVAQTPANASGNTATILTAVKIA